MGRRCSERSLTSRECGDGDRYDHEGAISHFIERPAKVTEFVERKMAETRRTLREQHKDEWRQAAAEEIASLLKGVE